MRIAILLLALLLSASANAELYRWVDNEGRVHYGDRPQPGSEDVEQLKLGKEPTPSENIPYETQRAMQNFPVTLYAFPGCGSPCQQARDFLNRRGIPFTEKSLITQEDINAYRKESGDSQLPALTIGKTWLKGFLAEQWNKELDFAGYPKSAPSYRPATPTPAPTQ